MQIFQLPCCRGIEDKHGAVMLSRQASSLLQLTAAVHHLSAWSASTGTADAGRPDLPYSKKLKVQASGSAHVNAMLKGKLPAYLKSIYAYSATVAQSCTNSVIYGCACWTG